MEIFRQWTAESIVDLSAFGNPIILFLIYLTFFGFREIWLFFGMIIILEVICGIIKFLYPKKRPDPKSTDNFFEKISNPTFPSVHAARIMAFAVFASALLINSVLAQIMLLLMIVFVGFSRIFLRKHRWVDVAAGWLIGFVVSYAYLSYVL